MELVGVALIPLWVKLLIIFGLIGPMGFLLVVITRGLRYEHRYEREYIRRTLTPTNQKLFWSWAIAFPAMIAIGCGVGIILKLGSDTVSSELLGGATAGGLGYLLTFVLMLRLNTDPTKRARDGAEARNIDPGRPDRPH